MGKKQPVPEFPIPDSRFPTPHSPLPTDPGTVLGTVSYMSPEQARGLETDARSDIFSLGVVLYEMIAGRRPFEGATPADVIASLLGQEPPPLADLAPDAASESGELQRLISRMLAKDRAGRFQTAEELRRALKKLKQELAPPGDFSTREFSGLSLLARRFGGARGDFKTIIDTAPAPARATARVSLLVGWFTRSLFRGAVALATLALALIGAVLGWQWLASRGAPVNSIAVLPFASASADPQMEYLSDGLTESLSRNLSQLPELRVMARGTVFTYKGREADPRQVGAALNVRAVVTGRVEQRDDKLIIEIELADASDGARIWGEQYRRPASEILTVQEEIAHTVARQLRLKLSGAQQHQLAKRDTENAAAYHLYLQGRFHFLQYNRASLYKAFDYFQQAIARDPQYALAHAGVADVYNELSSQHLAPSEALPKAKQAALRAVKIDDQLAEAHHSLAVVKWLGDWDWAGAEAEFKRALDLNPNAGTTYSVYAEFLLRLKRYEEALALARRAEELDPLSAPIRVMVGSALYYLGRCEQAIAHCRKSLELDPGHIWARTQIAHCLLQQGRYEEVIAELRRAQEINRHDTNLSFLGYVYAVAGRRAEARQALAELEIEARRRHVSPIYPARVYAGLGEKDRALALLRQAYDERSDHVLYLNTTPFFKSLRSDPRFVELLRRAGLPQ